MESLRLPEAVVLERKAFMTARSALAGTCPAFLAARPRHDSMYYALAESFAYALARKDPDTRTEGMSEADEKWWRPLMNGTHFCAPESLLMN